MKAFDEYTSKFDMTNRMTMLKYNHSYRVRDLSKLLATKLGLSDEDIKLATLIGMLHDIGRFEQVERFNTLSDINTMDHGDFGVYLLFEEGLISKFTDEKENYEIIKVGVKGHNKYEFYKGLDDRTSLHLKIIRDTDKLDIFNIFANLDELDYRYDGKISEKVKEEFYNHKQIHNDYKKSNADMVIGFLSFIYDLNFDESFKYLDSEQFISKLYNRIEKPEEKEQLKEFFDYAKKYVEEKLNKIK